MGDAYCNIMRIKYSLPLDGSFDYSATFGALERMVLGWITHGDCTRCQSVFSRYEILAELFWGSKVV